MVLTLIFTAVWVSENTGTNEASSNILFVIYFTSKNENNINNFHLYNVRKKRLT